MSKKREQELVGSDDSFAFAKPAKKQRRFKEKHSLDSDEEDELVENNALDEDDIEGEEETTIEDDDGIKITPFNMREEMEEGHFDTEGYYHFRKDADISDAWIDNIDWVTVKKQQKKKDLKTGQGKEDSSEDKMDGDESSSDESNQPVDKIDFYNKMLDIIKPGETVTKAMRRLGGGTKGRSSASSRWKKGNVQSVETKDSARDSADLDKLTAFADELLAAGEYDIYQATYEKLKHHIDESKKPVTPRAADDDDVLDMFADDIDQSTLSKATTKSQMLKHTKLDGDIVDPSLINEVCWEFKWEDKPEAPVNGPHTSTQMQKWVDEGKFPDGVYVRKVGTETDAAFYSSKRIDFELYTD